MYKIYILGYGCIYDASNGDDKKQFIRSPQLDIEANSAGTLSFVIGPNMDGYTKLELLTHTIYVERMNTRPMAEHGIPSTIIWAGRVLEDERDINNDKTITCEGALAFLNDSIQPNSRQIGRTYDYHFRTIIDFHNSQMATNSRRLSISAMPLSYLQKIDDELSRVYGGDTLYNPLIRENVSTLELLTTQFLNKWGGYFKLSYWLDDVKHENPEDDLIISLDYIDAYRDTPTVDQEIRFGENLLTLTRSASAEDFATMFYPVGSALDDSNKSWVLCSHYQNGRYKHYNSDRTYQDSAYVFGQRIDSETGLFTSTTDQNYALVEFIPVNPGERYFLTTYMQGVPASQSSDAQNPDGAAAFVVHAADQHTTIMMGNTAKNSINRDTHVEEQSKIQLEMESIEIPENGKFLSIGIYQPNGNSKPFKLKKFNPDYSEESLSIISIPTHTPVKTNNKYTDPIKKNGISDWIEGYDVYPSESGSINATSQITKSNYYFNYRTVINQELFDIFGPICRVFSLPEAENSADFLYGRAVTALEKMTEKVKLEITAADLSFIDDSILSFNLYDCARIVSPPHSLNEVLPILSMSLDLSAPENSEFSFHNEVETRDGEPSYMTAYMSDMYKKGKG